MALVSLFLFIGSAAAAPSVDTSGFSEVKTDSFRANGDLIDLDGASEVNVSFEYRPVGDSSWNESSVETVSSTGSFDRVIDGLNSNTEYEFQALATDGEAFSTGSINYVNTTMLKTVSGGESSFSTNELNINTLDITADSNVGTSFLRFRGEVTNLESVEPVQFNFSYREESESEWSTVKAESLTSSGVFTERVDGLEPNTTYEYMAHSKYMNREIREVNTTMLKTTYGGGVGFSTEALDIDTLEIDQDSNVGTGFLRFRGQVNNLDSVEPVQFNFSYRKEGESDWHTVRSEELTESGVFTERIDGLEPNTRYEYKAHSKYRDRPVRSINTTMLKTVSGGTVGIRVDSLRICDSRGEFDECISETTHNVGGETFDVSSIFQSRETSIFEATQQATLNITNSSSISGLWTGSFYIRAEKPRLEAGAEFRPESGRIIIGK